MIVQVEMIVAVRGDDEDVMESEARAFASKHLAPDQTCNYVAEWEGRDGAVCYKFLIQPVENAR
jgi:hypothetical protein